MCERESSFCVKYQTGDEGYCEKEMPAFLLGLRKWLKYKKKCQSVYEIPMNS